MGAWGTGLFSSDLACDVRDEYRELLGDEVADDEAEARIIADYSDLDGDEAPEFWIVLAMVQFKVGRLSDGVRERAARFIADEADLARWEDSGGKTIERRRAVLAKVADQIAGEQPARKKIRREWRMRRTSKRAMFSNTRRSTAESLCFGWSAYARTTADLRWFSASTSPDL